MIRLRDRIVRSGHHFLQRATMTTAAITGSEPLATLLCNSAERSIVNGLRETARRCRDRSMHVRMYVFDELADQREALLTPVRAIIWDGHSNGDDDEPGVDGSPLAGIFGRDRRRITTEAFPRAYQRLAALIRQQIGDGTLQPGRPTPSITSLSQEHGHARQTCSKALRILEGEGL